MISKKMEAALNEQINREMYSAYLYMSMSSAATDKGLDGFARWFMVQYHEEMFHAMKIYQYVIDQNGRALLKAIAEPAAQFSSIREMFDKTLEHEQFITKSIHDLVNLAIDERDHATHNFLGWYVDEQVEEEKNDYEILAKLDLIARDGKEGPGLYMLDKEIGARSVTIPTDFSAAGYAESSAG
jgi:ferritin